MTAIIPFIHYLSTGLLISLPVIGVGIGQGIASKALISAMNRQPASSPHLKRLFVLIMASLETSVILPALMCIPLFTLSPSNTYSAISLLGIVTVLGLPGMAIGISSALPSKAAVNAVARNPHAEQSVMNILLITLSIIQTPIIFGLIIGWFQVSQVSYIDTMTHMLQILGSGIALGLGSVGPAIGIGRFAQQALHGVGRAPHMYPQLLSFTFLSQAIIETPILFALVTSLAILLVNVAPGAPLLQGIVMLLAGITIAIPTLIIGLSSSRIASTACRQIPDYPESYKELSQMSLLGQAIIDTTVLYCLIVAFVLLFSF